MDSVVIAIDYDDTYTADPDLWDHFIQKARELGHKVVCVSCRRTGGDNHDILKQGPKVPVYFTNMAPKRWYMDRNGISVDIWIDDMPECVTDGR